MNREPPANHIQPPNTLEALRQSRIPLLVQWAAPLILLFSLILTVETVVYKEKQHSIDQHMGRLIDNSNELRTLFESELYASLYVANGISSYIQSKQGEISDKEMSPWLTNLKERGEHIRNIGIAPGNHLLYVYPLQGNEAALGLYYPDNKEQWPAVEKTIRSKHPVMAGPVNLRQGGLGLIYREPIFIEDNYWGLVSTVINFDDLYKIIEHRAQELHIKINVTDLDGVINPLFGPPNLNPEYELTLNIPGRQWRLNTQSTAPLNFGQAYLIRGAGWFLSLFLAGMLFAFLYNLHQKQQASAALQTSQARLAQIFHNAPQGILLINATGHIESANKSVADSLGYSLDALLQKNFFELLAPSQRDRINNVIEGLTPTSHHNNPYESIMLDMQGENIYVVLGLSPVTTESSNKDWIIQIIDISYRVSYERLLHEEAIFKQTLINILPQALLIVNQNGLITASNSAAHHMFGAEANLISGCSINELIIPSTHESFLNRLSSLKTSILISQISIQNLVAHKFSGKTLPIEATVATVARKSEPFYIISIKELNQSAKQDHTEAAQLT